MENPQQDVILIQEAVGDSLQGFRAVPPGASPAVNPINRNSTLGVSALDGMKGGEINTMSRHYDVLMQDPPMLAPMGRAFSLDARPNETSGFSVSGYGRIFRKFHSATADFNTTNVFTATECHDGSYRNY